MIVLSSWLKGTLKMLEEMIEIKWANELTLLNAKPVRLKTTSCVLYLVLLGFPETPCSGNKSAILSGVTSNEIGGLRKMQLCFALFYSIHCLCIFLSKKRDICTGMTNYHYMHLSLNKHHARQQDCLLKLHNTGEWEIALEHRSALPEWCYLLSYDNANVPL